MADDLTLDELRTRIDEIDSKIPKLVLEIEDKLRQFSNTKYTISTS